MQKDSSGTLVQLPAAAVTRKRLEFSYDARGRRIGKRVLSATGSGGFVLQQCLVHLYDGWNMIAEIDTTSTAQLLRSYEWGADISGTMTGAGGVGGLLIERFHPVSSIQQQGSSHAPCYDGNGNLSELVNLANGSVSARYEYGAFGETISVDGGAVAAANPFRFSTKHLDVETGFYNYGYRYYDPVNGRWLNRDPIGINGGVNLYGMVGNDPVNHWDVLGMCKFRILVERVRSINIVGTLSNITAYCDQKVVWKGVGREPPSDSGTFQSEPIRLTRLRKDGAWGPYFVKPGRTGPRSEVFDYPNYKDGEYQMHTIPNGSAKEPSSRSPANGNWGQSGENLDGTPDGTWNRTTNDIRLSTLDAPGSGCIWAALSFWAAMENSRAVLYMKDSRLAMDQLIQVYKKCCPDQCPFYTEFKWNHAGVVPVHYWRNQFPNGIQGVQW